MGSARTRLFVAAEIDEEVRRRAGEIQSRLRAAGDAGRAISWVAPQNLHVTLQFIGDVEPEVAGQVAAQLEPPFESPPFELSVSGVGTFPPAGQPRVIWLGVERGGVELAAVAREVNRRLDEIALPRDRRPFRAHLTLGRVKGAMPAQAREALAAARSAAVGRCRVDHVTLFQSTLSPHGSSYTIVATSRLGYHQSS
jgi:RNA 2',3'-cyclic 3'-phosphodiesterase